MTPNFVRMSLPIRGTGHYRMTKKEWVKTREPKAQTRLVGPQNSLRTEYVASVSGRKETGLPKMRSYPGFLRSDGNGLVVGTWASSVLCSQS